MKNFLTVTAISEGITGITLIVLPQFIVSFLLSTPLQETGGIVAARIAGIAITFLALNCWFSKNDTNNSGVLKSLLFYNFAIIAIFLYTVIGYGFSGLFLWLVVLAHAALGLWNAILLRKN